MNRVLRQWTSLDVLTSRLPVPRLVIVLEGISDIGFLVRMSRMLHAHDPRLPDLGRLEATHQVVFVPVGGGNLQVWTHRLAGFSKPEFHLYDLESPPETLLRQRIARAVNRRPGCLAMLTSKRAMENYLHTDAIFEASGIRVEVDDGNSVAEAVARERHLRAGNCCWDQLSPRTRKRLRDRAKRWLNTTAVEQMTLWRLRERDPQEDVSAWLHTIGMLISDGGRVFCHR